MTQENFPCHLMVWCDSEEKMLILILMWLTMTDYKILKITRTVNPEMTKTLFLYCHTCSYDIIFYLCL